jgi:putative sterol carrier protein
MPTFPSREWCELAIRLINADPEAKAAGAGWRGDVGAVIEAEPGVLERPFTLHLVPVDGTVERWKLLADPDDLEELEPAYLARAPYAVWKGLLRGTLDPMEAVLKRRIAVQGDLQPVLERMKYKGVAMRLLAQLETTFVDED